MSVSKSWTFTKNNYDHTDIDFFIEWPEFTYMVFGREVAPTTGTCHLQGYFTLKNASRPAHLKSVLPKGTHFEIARKPELANFRYCSKCLNYTVVDRRHGRDGLPRTVTESQPTSRQPSVPESGSLDRFVSRSFPGFPLRNLFRR